MNIAVAGIGYAGLSSAVLLAQHNHVTAVDIQRERVDALNRRQPPVADPEMEQYLKEKPLDLAATTDGEPAYRTADFVIIATPTNYDERQDRLDTSSVESVIRQVTELNPQAVIVIKSTVPVGFTRRARKQYGNRRVLFSPEFLREGRALYDNLHPSRIIVGVPEEDADLERPARAFADLLARTAAEQDVPRLLMGLEEAEAVKLFANTYLALRVAFFNELDTYAEARGLACGDIIRGVCLDPRIGGHYNNPSFGYGGYCLPKDARQLKTCFEGVPSRIVSAVVEANRVRKDFIANQIAAREPDTVGIYRLTMKTGSDNFRQSSVQDVMRRLREKGVHAVVYEPALQGSEFMGFELVHSLEDFKARCDLIVANRLCPELDDVRDKVYSRDLYLRD